MTWGWTGRNTSTSMALLDDKTRATRTMEEAQLIKQANAVHERVQRGEREIKRQIGVVPWAVVFHGLDVGGGDGDFL